MEYSNIGIYIYIYIGRIHVARVRKRKATGVFSHIYIYKRFGNECIKLKINKTKNTKITENL